MTKSAKNGLVAVAVAAVVVGAATPFIVKGIKNQPAKAEDTTAAVITQADVNAYPVEEDTTADIISQILETVDAQQQTQAAAPVQDYQTAPAQQAAAPQTAPQQTAAPQTAAPQTAAAQTTAAQQQTSTTKTSFWNRNKTTTQAPATTTTTKPAKTTTTKPAKTTKATTTKATTAKATTTKASSGGNDPMTTVSGQEAMSSGGIVSYLWDPNGNFYYVDDNPWQRNFGFNAIYDWAAATLVMYYDTWRACFTYDDLEWMIQAWKGQYGFLFIGGEIGVYTREPGAAVLTSSHYNCADDNHLINMEMSIYYDAHDGNGYKKLFTRSFYPHWWCTGFVDGHLADYQFNDRSCLIMTARMRMYDADMVNAFTTALVGCGFTRVDSTSQVSTTSTDTFTVVGNDVHFSWKKIDQGYKTR